MLRPSSAPLWRYFLSTFIVHCRITRFDEQQQQQQQPLTFSLAGTRCSRTLPPLIHSLTAPGGLDLSRPLSLHSCHFTRPPKLFSAHVGAPPYNSQNSMHFSPAKIVFSPPPKFLSPARPVLQRTRCWEVCVSLQAAR